MSNPVVVVHVLGRLTPGGGVQVVVRGLIQHLDPTLVKSHVVTTRPWFDRDRLDEVPAEIHPLNHRGGFRLRDRARLCLAAAWRLMRIRPDVVQLHSGIAWVGILARLVMPRTAFVLEVHDAPGSGRHRKRNDQFEGWCVRRLGVTAVSHSVEVQEAVEQQSRRTGDRVRRFALGVDTELFRPRDEASRRCWRKAQGISNDSTLVVAVGRPAPSKRFDLAIEALAHGRSLGAQLELMIVGVGDSSELFEAASRLGVLDHVFLLSSRYGEDLAEAVGAGDVLSSTSEYEGFGLTLAEGMACGIPVVAMNVGGVSDVVVDGVTGILVDPGDVAAHGERLAELRRDPALAKNLGSKGRARAESALSMSRVVDDFTALYDDLAQR